MKELPEIEALMKEFQEATNEYESAHQKSQRASSEETNALNRLSRAQKEIDEWHKAVKKSAPWNSDWQQQVSRKDCGLEVA